MRRFLTLFVAMTLAVATLHAQSGPVIATGAMRNTMFNGQLAGLISLDSLSGVRTYGLGPLEYLRGELLLLDGRAYCSTVVNDTLMRVTERTDVRAPFFVHQRVARWHEVELPDSVIDLRSLDAFLTARYGALPSPFAFRLTGVFAVVDVHVLDVPLATTIQGPSDAHRHNKHYHLADAPAEALGFFSTQHKTVFTHHDAHIHVHAITPARDWMGHVETMRFGAGQVRLWVAAE